ncbi:P-loop containing nucleoside triphosphate hydrolase protein, partial [Baffinella frigidus]
MLDAHHGAILNGSSGAAPNGSKPKPISLREGPNNSIQAVGIIEAHVEDYDEMFNCLERGSVCRSTGSTSMNSVSSRSHAIFTVTIEQSSEAAGLADENADPNLATGATTDRKSHGKPWQTTGGWEEGADATGQASNRSVITSKFHFVDLAGSERCKKTQAAGDRMKEGININYGLLVL